MPFPDSSLPVTNLNPGVVSAIQDRTLVRTFRDALYPRLMFRLEAAAELWATNLGANTTFTRAGLIQPTTRPVVPGVDPQPVKYDLEQWEATAQQWAAPIDTSMPTSYVTLASQYLRNLHQLGLHAGQSVNRVVRDKLFNSYVAGNTVVNGVYGGGTALPVINLCGFTRKLINGRPQLVSANNPLPITVKSVNGGADYTGNVIGFTVGASGDEIHAGTLTLDAAIAATAGREAVLAVNRAQIMYSGGGFSVDDVGAGDIFSLADVSLAVAQMRFDNVPAHEDGSYHVHLDPISEARLFRGDEWQRLNQSIPDYVHYRRMAAAYIMGCTFYRNSEAPTTATVNENPVYGFTTGFELQNGLTTPVLIHRPIFTGQGAIEEKYLDESRYISEAGVQGKIGEFSVVNGGVQIMAERIRLILRSPQDRLQQITSAAWSYSGDFPIPTDATALSSPAAFKRAVIVCHA